MTKPREHASAIELEVAAQPVFSTSDRVLAISDVSEIGLSGDDVQEITLPADWLSGLVPDDPDHDLDR